MDELLAQFDYSHLRGARALRVAKQYAELAQALSKSLPRCGEGVAAMQRLLQSRDFAVAAAQQQQESAPEARG